MRESTQLMLLDHPDAMYGNCCPHVIQSLKDMTGGALIQRYGQRGGGGGGGEEAGGRRKKEEEEEEGRGKDSFQS